MPPFNVNYKNKDISSFYICVFYKESDTIEEFSEHLLKQMYKLVKSDHIIYLQILNYLISEYITIKSWLFFL